MQQDRKTFLTGLRALLSYHEVLGLEHYPLNKDTRSFLELTPVPVRKGKVPAVPAGEAARARSSDLRKVSSSPPATATLAEIGEEVNTCRACELHEQRIYPVAGRGSEKARLLIVGDWLRSDEQGRLPAGLLFGVEQDRMLARMLAAINLPVTEVFISNVIKCAVPIACQPQAEHVQSCISYLRRQIAVISPEIICTMGMVAARVVLEKALPLSRLRGRLHSFEVAPGTQIPVLTTYHPGYLLQNPEMKAATWADLQFLARQLGLPTT